MRVYRLFNRIAKGLEPVAAIFRSFVEQQGLAQLRAATEAAEAKQVKDKESGRIRLAL